jgi:hypothetical protein
VGQRAIGRPVSSRVGRAGYRNLRFTAVVHLVEVGEWALIHR